MVGKKFLENLEKLRKDIFDMGNVVCETLDEAIVALERRDVESKKVFYLEEESDILHTRIQERCIKLIALHQPVASDLRFLTSAMAVGSNLERIADYAVDIAKIIPYISEEKNNMEEISKMGKIAHEMTIEATKAFVNKDGTLVKKVEKKEEELDEFYKLMFSKLEEMVEKEPKRFILALNLLLVSRYLERIGDHAINVSKKTMYAIKGEEEYLR